ncbi:hypothetical protein [Noviherbaspirillum aridicola]|uniref:Uncharacterized protein n=1 Tax=Noviherbaspirillum aridicola TaxID=2849687 RepID=A0ABQ4PZC6_9BURK|nr:hypothetical protein [Noviherbaspirillum aridicola]GIZ50238.1 hypothetical protein NCCP691_02520 [Noviherbaspirillum aridicola]
MKNILPLTLLVLSVSACSGMRGMESSGGSSQSLRAYPESNYNSTNYPVVDPRTGELTYYHGG